MKIQRAVFLALTGLAVTVAASLPAHSAPSGQRYLVEFVDGKTNNGKAALKAANAVIKLDLGKHNAVAAEIADAKLNALKSNPNIKSVELDEARYPDLDGAFAAKRSGPQGDR